MPSSVRRVVLRKEGNMSLTEPWTGFPRDQDTPVYEDWPLDP